VGAKTRVEYVWLDGRSPLPKVRSKTRFIEAFDAEFPCWNFDGGSTEQGSLENSDRYLKPIRTYSDPFHEKGFLVFCEVWNYDDTPHESNTRCNLVNLVKENEEGFLVGFEQEFTLMNPETGQPLGFILQPTEQKDYYCGAGTMNVVGRYLLNDFEQRCQEAGVDLDGINAEVMPGQWEFQTGAQDPLKCSDDLWVARYILERVSEFHSVVVSYDPKPHPEFNGAGCHTNVSNSQMRECFGIKEFEELMKGLEVDHHEHIKVCGNRIEARMTGECETSDYKKFTFGVGDRGASVRIPKAVAMEGHGYFEDRRPCANIDPYKVLCSLLSSINKSYVWSKV
jgi:glutamine synthetase